jgi:hypothetical protein
MKLSKNYRIRLKEYLYFANRMKRGNCKVLLSSSGPFGIENWQEALDGKSAVECLFKFESTGKRPLVKTGQKAILEWLLVGKSARDWHITQWSEGIVEGVLYFYELREDRGMPPTIIESVRKAVKGLMERQLHV